MAHYCSLGGLRPLGIEELVLGRRLPGHVRDHNGRILIRKGQRLSDEHLHLLGERIIGKIFADEEWPPPIRVIELDRPMATPDELLHALRRRRCPPGGPSRVRRHPRHQWRTRLRVTISQRTEGLVLRREMMVTTQDICLGGFSFVCGYFVYVDTVVYARFEALPKRPIMKGIVRNCEYVSGRRYRVGVEFVELDPSETVPYL